ncbi:MAG: signal peptidase II [Candidatus Buchananbacteria bacterium RIFCSPHIGHO2_01_FULL_39_8]|uniref:Lipoprotein signal peptidase n=1 Tax=Candidatus Buchananbacteria bacterium RIFCSPHIGHO2_01_FULL_39_8 TaxID=1797533 RepID=A0A1G1XYQ4_9BACT|nr:MAG: signal peptidase II [Candidatus Buchananbacteria bacterium RIFCSPHIGHO2_01_FULL_39_8]
MLKKIISLNLAIFILFIVDRILKFWFLKNPGFSRDFIDDFLSFELETNPGIAFGLPLDGTLLLLLVIVIIFALFNLLRKAYRQRKFLEIFLISLIVFGAISNLIDRLRYGFVIDYINVPFFTVFNLADAMITVGVALLALELFSKNSRRGTGQEVDV